jgi:hypothetical protein
MKCNALRLNAMNSALHLEWDDGIELQGVMTERAPAARTAAESVSMS